MPVDNTCTGNTEKISDYSIFIVLAIYRTI